MLKKRKPQPNTVLTYSIVLGLVLIAAAAYEAYHQGWVWAALWGALALWFFVDAFRAYGWLKNAETQQQETEQAAQVAAEAKQAQRAAAQTEDNVFAKKNAATAPVGTTETQPKSADPAPTVVRPEDSGAATNPLIERDKLK